MPVQKSYRSLGDAEAAESLDDYMREQAQKLTPENWAHQQLGLPGVNSILWGAVMYVAIFLMIRGVYSEQFGFAHYSPDAATWLGLFYSLVILAIMVFVLVFIPLMIMATPPGEWREVSLEVIPYYTGTFHFSGMEAKIREIRAEERGAEFKVAFLMRNLREPIYGVVLVQTHHDINTRCRILAYVEDVPLVAHACAAIPARV